MARNSEIADPTARLADRLETDIRLSKSGRSFWKIEIARLRGLQPGEPAPRVAELIARAEKKLANHELIIEQRTEELAVIKTWH